MLYAKPLAMLQAKPLVRLPTKPLARLTIKPLSVGPLTASKAISALSAYPFIHQLIYKLLRPCF